MVYNYTKPRGPIAAMYSSPGPCYALPGLVGQKTHDPRSVHTKQPAFPFGIRHGKFADDCSPGPQYLPDSKIFRDGKDGTPHYSLYSRPKDGTQFKTPGPGSYSPEHSGPTAQFRHPQYSFGIRHRNRRTDNTPAPNSYSLPNMVGKTTQSNKRQAPCYSLTGRSNVGSFDEDLSKTPGPGTYSTTDPGVFKDKAPCYSLGGTTAGWTYWYRTRDSFVPGCFYNYSCSPGPAAYLPEYITFFGNKSPYYSFGIRHKLPRAPIIVDKPE